jgi:hypothetical protein
MHLLRLSMAALPFWLGKIRQVVGGALCWFGPVRDRCPFTDRGSCGAWMEWDVTALVSLNRVVPGAQRAGNCPP